MKNHLLQIIRTLKDSDAPVTSGSLANKLNVSPRSVKSYIQEINATAPDTIFSSRKGYVIDRDKADELLNVSRSSVPQTAEERVNYLINAIIKRGLVNAYDLCDEMFISYSTLKADLASVRKILSKGDLELVNQNDTLVVNGLEKNKRKLLSSLLYSESRNNIINYERMSSTFENIDVLYLKDTILNKFEEHRFFINDYSLENLILHSAITIDRIRNGYDSDSQNKVPSVLKSHEYELANDIIRSFEEKFGIRFNESEVGEFAMLILSRASNLDYETVTIENVRHYVGEDIYQLTTDIIKDFSTYYFFIDLSKPEFFVRFALHLKNLLIRANSGYFSKNPLTDSIKQNCPLIYDSAVNAARMIKEKTGIDLNDDEIAYIAFHIGGALELQSDLSNKITCSIFCPSYYNLNNRLADTIAKKFSDSLVISAIITQEEDISKVNSDLLISTMHTDLKIPVPSIVISPIITKNDLDDIQNKISEIKIQKKQHQFKENLSNLIRQELFFVIEDKLSKEEIIHFMADKLRTHGYASDTFESDVLERDAISSTAFGTFAIPHAMKMNEYKTGICVCLCKDPIEWDECEVELIMMLCFNRNDRQLFNELFEPLSMILVDPDNLNKAIRTKNADEFISVISGLLD